MNKQCIFLYFMVTILLTLPLLAMYTDKCMVTKEEILTPNDVNVFSPAAIVYTAITTTATIEKNRNLPTSESKCDKKAEEKLNKPSKKRIRIK